MSEDDNRPRFSAATPGRHEAWYLTVSDGMTGQGFWIRTSYVVPERRPAFAEVSFARFHRGEPSRTFGLARRLPIDQLHREDGVALGLRAGGVEISSGRARGAIGAPGRSAAWDLEFPVGGETLRIVPPLLRRRGLAPLTVEAPNPDTRVSGTVTVDGETSHFESVPAQQGHVWGSDWPERWAWAHCGGFEEEDGAVDLLSARTRRFGLPTPMLTFAVVRWGGRRVRLARAGGVRELGLGLWRIDLSGSRYRLSGRVEAPARALLRARYQGPSGASRFCHHTDVASSRLALFERRSGGFEQIALLESRGTTSAEWGGRTPAPQVERELEPAGEGATT